MDQITAQGPPIETLGQMVRKGGEHAFFHRMLRRRLVGQIEPLAVRDILEFLGQLRGLPRRLHVDAERAAPRRIKAGLAGDRKGTQLHQNIGICPVPEHFVATLVHLARSAFDQQPASLGEGGQPTGGFDTTKPLRLEKQTRVTRMHREGEHATSEVGDVSSVVERPEVTKQFHGPRQSPRFGRFEPAESGQIPDPRGFERKHHLGQVQPLHFGQLALRPLFMVLGHPEPHTTTRRGAPRPPGALVG